MSMDGPRLLQALQSMQDEMKKQRATSEQLTMTVVSALQSIKQPQRETVIFGPSEWTFEANGYPYNWVIASDSLSGVNLTVVERGQQYTFTLQPGANILNLTDGAVVTAQNPIQVMFVRDTREPQIMTGQRVIATLSGSLPAGTNNIGEVSLSGSNTTTINQASIATANTAQQLPNVPCREVTIIALGTNSGPIYIGTSGVSNTTGIPFNNGDSQTFPISNLNLLYIYGNAGDGVAYVAS